MPKKKGTRAAQPSAKTAFILGLPSSTPAKEAVARAKEKGFETTLQQVYALRSYARLKRTPARSASGAAGKAVRKTKVAKAARASSARAGRRTGVPRAISVAGDSEQQLLRIVVDLGLRQTEQLLDRVRARLLTLAKA